MKLHLGCGTRRLPGYTHIDGREEVHPDMVADVRNLDWILNNTVETIYACHVLEHIALPELPATLQEWSRVLYPRGLLRLSVPDFDAIARLYAHEQTILMRLLGLLYGGGTYAENVHHACYDYQTLAYLLGKNGFHSITTWEPYNLLGNEWPKDYDDYSMAVVDDIPVSLNIEAKAK